ncbi:nucleotidyltransferase family protein [Thiocapsa sp.]|uniref:nucleotidyltransferase family protein n=1 Tax=Thiocapsa sp. TaxID=2024551 RepID=UPI002C9AF797|nr:nucleotidyltransferase family protein [Thiocapsa sp.]HSO84715.1 nucleotidyltransferase family protein [Thiocapsa sp.]
MPALPHTVPPRTRLWHALAALLDPAGVVPDPLDDARVPDWIGIYRLAAGQLVAPGLYVALAARQRLEAVPEPVRMALAELHRLNGERNDRLLAVLRDTVHLLNAAGFEPLLLKGAVALLPGSDPLAAARMLSDLDLALCDGTAEQGEQVLRAAGYRDADNCNPDHYGPPMHHAAPLFHPGGDGSPGTADFSRREGERAATDRSCAVRGDSCRLKSAVRAVVGPPAFVFGPALC